MRVFELIEGLEHAKSTIVSAVSLPLIDSANTKIARRILNRYNEYYFQLMNMKV